MTGGRGWYAGVISPCLCSPSSCHFFKLQSILEAGEQSLAGLVKGGPQLYKVSSPLAVRAAWSCLMTVSCIISAQAEVHW